jgi:hypothetical protein
VAGEILLILANPNIPDIGFDANEVVLINSIKEADTDVMNQVGLLMYPTPDQLDANPDDQAYGIIAGVLERRDGTPVGNLIHVTNGTGMGVIEYHECVAEEVRVGATIERYADVVTLCRTGVTIRSDGAYINAFHICQTSIGSAPGVAIANNFASMCLPVQVADYYLGANDLTILEYGHTYYSNYSTEHNDNGDANTSVYNDILLPPQIGDHLGESIKIYQMFDLQHTGSFRIKTQGDFFALSSCVGGLIYNAIDPDNAVLYSQEDNVRPPDDSTEILFTGGIADAGDATFIHTSFGIGSTITLTPTRFDGNFRWMCEVVAVVSGNGSIGTPQIANEDAVFFPDLGYRDNAPRANIGGGN